MDLNQVSARLATDDDFADRLGKHLAKTYGLKKKRVTDRYDTAHGDKSAGGLARMMVRDFIEFDKEITRITNIPTEVLQWVDEIKGEKIPIHDEGMYETYANSKSSCCWGSYGGMVVTNKIRIAVCQPSRLRKDSPMYLRYDFKITA